MLRYLILCLLSLATVAYCYGDGKLYHPDIAENIAEDIPYQRAIIVHDGNEETLILQSKAASLTAMEAAWVVPVPNIPEVYSMNAELAEEVFSYLAFRARPDVTSISLLLLLFGVPLTGSVAAIFLILRVFSSARPSLRRYCISNWVILFMFLSSLFSALTVPTIGGAVRGVEVVKAQSVGVFDTRVIRSDSSEALLGWLKENDFASNVEDQAVLDHYVQQGWCFVTAKVRTGEKHEPEQGGLMDPLILRFAAKKPVYPLALTATIGSPTEVLLYLVTHSKMQTDQGMSLTYAGVIDLQALGFHSRILNKHTTKDENVRKWEEWERSAYLTKFKATLTPEEMQTDLYFTPAPDNKPYRKHIVTW